jgi:hypothetical protein
MILLPVPYAMTLMWQVGVGPLEPATAIGEDTVGRGNARRAARGLSLRAFPVDQFFETDGAAVEFGTSCEW